jgi:Transposase DDE domain
MIGVANPTFDLGGPVDADLDTLAIALYVKIDDELKIHPELVRWRPEVGFRPELSDAELATVAVLQALGGFTSEARFIRYARRHLVSMFPHLPNQSGYNKALRKAVPMLQALIKVVGMDTSAYFDDVWLVDSTPVECARSRPTVQRSNLAGLSSYGYCASHSRYFWGLRLHLVTTPSGLPIAFALASTKADEREVLRDLLEVEPELLEGRRGQLLFADKGYTSRELEGFLAEQGVTLVRPSRKDERPRPGARFLRPLRQIIESVNDTLKGQLDLERHGGHSPQGVIVRVLQRLLALTAAIWHNERCGEPVLRSLVAYDHG